jgi:hypothetical protein
MDDSVVIAIIRGGGTEKGNRKLKPCPLALYFVLKLKTKYKPEYAKTIDTIVFQSLIDNEITELLFFFVLF